MSESDPRTLSGRVAVVTGATSGIGREVARGLALLGATTVVVGRGPDRAASVAAEIARTTGNPQVEALQVTDLAEMGDVRELAGALLERYPSLHVLVNNAGGFFWRREVTADGLERTFALNVLAPYLLTTLLASRLIASAPARVVNVASTAHRGARVDLSDLQSTRRYSGYRVYGASKLELIWLSREFARRFQGTRVTVNALHPGYIRSGFGLNNGGGIAFAMRILARLFGKSVARGAETPLYVASAPELSSVTGAYFSNRSLTPGSMESQDLAKARAFFDACARVSGEPPLASP